MWDYLFLQLFSLRVFSMCKLCTLVFRDQELNHMKRVEWDRGRRRKLNAYLSVFVFLLLSSFIGASHTCHPIIESFLECVMNNVCGANGKISTHCAYECFYYLFEYGCPFINVGRGFCFYKHNTRYMHIIYLFDYSDADGKQMV